MGLPPDCLSAVISANAVLGSVEAVTASTPADFIARATGWTLVLPKAKLALTYPTLSPACWAETPALFADSAEDGEML